MIPERHIHIDSALVPKAHVPINHNKHTPDKPCGCIDPDTFEDKYLSCKYCGASYDFMEVLSFPVFRCYDCGSSTYLGPRKKRMKKLCELCNNQGEVNISKPDNNYIRVMCPYCFPIRIEGEHIHKSVLHKTEIVIKGGELTSLRYLDEKTV